MTTKEQKNNALFQFIDYLHGNIDNFKKYEGLIQEINVLNNEREKINDRKTARGQQKIDRINEEIKPKFNKLYDGMTQPIISKIEELNICTFDGSICYFKDDFSISLMALMYKEKKTEDDFKAVDKYKQLYIEFRNNIEFYPPTGELSSFFRELDKEYLADFFDYFKDNEDDKDFLTLIAPPQENLQAIPETILVLKKSISKQKDTESLKLHHKDEPAPEVVNTELLEQIKQRFEAMDKKGYQYAFRTEDDFNIFCNVLALYFDNGTFNDIETIQLNPRTKTRIASTLNLIYSKFIKDDLSLKTNKDFFRIVRFLAPYQEKTDDEIYKALIR